MKEKGFFWFKFTWKKIKINSVFNKCPSCYEGNVTAKGLNAHLMKVLKAAL